MENGPQPFFGLRSVQLSTVPLWVFQDQLLALPVCGSPSLLYLHIFVCIPSPPVYLSSKATCVW